MNKRIKELKRDATIWCDDNIPEQFSEETGGYGSAWEEKFAELIVRECAELSVNSQYANTKGEYYEGFNEALVYVGNKIKKHFGVNMNDQDYDEQGGERGWAER